MDEIVSAIQRSGYLPPVAGGRATWLVESNVPVAVVAQQWAEPKMLLPLPKELDELEVKHGTLRLHFNYHAQVDPQSVYDVFVNPTKQRIVSWLIYLVPIGLLLMVIWYPESFDRILRPTLRYSLELVLPISTHSWVLWRVNLDNGRRRWILTAVFGLISAIAFFVLHSHYTLVTFGIVTGLPGLYAVTTIFFQHMERKRANPA